MLILIIPQHVCAGFIKPAAVAAWLYCSRTGGRGDGMFDTHIPSHPPTAHPPPAKFSEAEPWDRPALMARQLMSTLDLSDSLGIM